MDRTPSAEVQKAFAEVERRMRAAAEEVLRRDWAAYGAAAAPGRTDEYQQVLKDAAQLPMLNKRESLAEYLQVVGSAQYGVESNLEDNLAIADKLIGLRRDLEIELLVGVVPYPAVEIWKILPRIVAAVAALVLALGAVAALFNDSTGLSAGEAAEVAMFLLAIAAMLILIFFGGWRLFLPRPAYEQALRREIAKRYEEER